MNFKNFKTLLFENIGIGQTIFKNTFWLTAAEAVSRLLGVILVIFVIRILGATEYGKFTFALAFVSLFAVFSDFGLSSIVIREISQSKENEKEYSAVFSLKIILSIITLVLMIGSSFFVAVDPAVRKIIFILAFYILISNFSGIISAFLEARQKMEYESAAKIVQTLFTVAVGIFILFKNPSVENLSCGYLFANLGVLIFILLFFNYYIYPLKLDFNTRTWKKFFGLCWPLGVASIFSEIFINMDSVMMGHLGKITQVGWYNAAQGLIGFATIPAVLFGVSFYPALSKFFIESKEKLQGVWNHYMELTIVLAVPMVMGGFILASKIINFIYNTSFDPSILVFKILIFSVGINFIYSPYVIMLIASSQQKKYLVMNLFAAITNIVLNLVLIPRYGLYGASFATIITYIVILIFGILFLKRSVPISIFSSKLSKILVIAVFSGLIMSIVISHSLVYNLNVIPVVIIGVSVYFTALLLFYKFLLKSNLLSKNT